MWLKRGAYPTAAQPQRLPENKQSEFRQNEQSEFLHNKNGNTEFSRSKNESHEFSHGKNEPSEHPHRPSTAAEPPAPHTSHRLPEKPSRPSPAARAAQPAPQGHRADVLAAVATPQPYQNETRSQAAPAASPLALVQKLWAEQPFPAFADTNSLQQHAAACTACRLHNERKQALSGRGAVPAQLMVISRNPAPSDDEAGQLLGGRHGQLLDNMLAAIRLAPEQVFRTAWQRCTPRISLQPTPEEQVRCAAFIRQEAAWIQPRALLLLGNSFYDPVQQWLTAQIAPGIPAFIVPHPAILLRQPELKAQTWATLKQLQQHLAKS
ncbi:uracil-DNA glycosylase [Eikenella longinqua]|nr:uracil-DNA glycosylase [Eikenella longinqua]